MGQVLGPYGLRVIKNLGEQYFTGGMREYPVATSAALTANGIFFGDPVNLSGGTIVPLTATPTAGASGVIGIFQGASWQDPIRGFVNSQFLPANIFAGGATNVKAKVVDYPWVQMRVQANGSVPLTSIGLNGALGNFAHGSMFTGNSQVFLDVVGTPPAATAALAVRIVDFVYDASPSPGAGSMPGDPYTDVIVIWNFGIHRYLNATGG